MPTVFDNIKIDNTYELFFPKKEQGLAIIWLYERVKNGYFDKGVFKEKDIRRALDEARLIDKIDRELKRERHPWEYYNSHIMTLQEFFLLYDEEHQTYTLKEFATYLCDKVFKMLSDRFNPTVIEITCSNLYENLKGISTERDLSLWLDAHFDKAKLHLKEQIDYLNQQIDKSVTELSEKAKLKSGSLLTTLRDIEAKIDEIRRQNGELRGAFREIDKIKSILMGHSARVNEQIDESVSVAIDYFESVRMLLNMVDSRIDKIQPKIQQLFASLNRQIFDTRVEKFLNYLLDKSQVTSNALKLPIANESFMLRCLSSNLTVIEKRDDLFLGKKNQPIVYFSNPENERISLQNVKTILFRNNDINVWLEIIKRELLHVTEYSLSDIFFKILKAHNEDLHLAVGVIYQAIYFYDKHEKWQININRQKLIQIEKHNYAIWDIGMKRK